LHHSGLTDAQCGFKAARTDVVRALLPHIKDGAWFFDTELLLLAEHNGFRLIEIPVDWVEDTDSKVAIPAVAAANIRGLLRVLRAKLAGAATITAEPGLHDEQRLGGRTRFTQHTSPRRA
jgi:hypothetical protein